MPGKKKVQCRHCGMANWSVGRGLCETCHKTPDVRAQHPKLPMGAAAHIAVEVETISADELDRLVAERMLDLPAWFEREAAAIGDDEAALRIRESAERFRARCVLPRKWRSRS